MRFALVILFALAASLQAQSPATQLEAGPTPPVQPEAAAAGKDVVHALNNAFARVFEIVAPSVVIIEATKKNEGTGNPALDDLFFNNQPDDAPRRNRERQSQSEGSGFIVRPDGHIYTNYHVVDGADRIDVKLKDGREFQAKLIGADEKTDVAVIKIEANNLPAVQMADSEAVRVGQFAFAIGAPFKLDYTFTYGVISGKGRTKLLPPALTGGYAISDYLQTDASINPGNSGGPLCDIDGKVVGMNTLINGLNRGLGFAIPINLANDIGQQLIAGQRILRPWLGIRIETLGEDPAIRELFKGLDKGVVVRTIE
ncbi:MAG TPA: trypsin-like peptidase domain-containing protein, partial [Chthoniobacterales bacterium]